MIPVSYYDTQQGFLQFFPFFYTFLILNSSVPMGDIWEIDL